MSVDCGNGDGLDLHKCIEVFPQSFGLFIGAARNRLKEGDEMTQPGHGFL